MSLGFFTSLMLRSAKLQREIDAENARPKPDSLRLLKLKKLRLVIKDKLYQLAKNADRKQLAASLSRPLSPALSPALSKVK